MDKTGRNGLRVGDILSVNFSEKFLRLKDKHFQLLNDIENDYAQMEKEFLKSIEFLKRF